MNRSKQYRNAFCLLAGCTALELLLPGAVRAEPAAPMVAINAGSAPEITTPEVFTALKLALMVSSLAVLPSVLMAVTCFPRIAIVLSLTRQALGTAQTPPNQLLIGLALFLTFAIMGSTFERIYNDSLVPYAEDQIGHAEAFQRAFTPLRDFMLPLTREQDIGLFLEITKTPMPDAPEKLGAAVVIPAFIVSELNTAFQIGFLIYVPFLILDMVISSILTSMSMITLPPTVISLPIKMILFVVIDGWSLIIGNLINSYHGAG
ncbi:MAG TPA: flagellar type III secretion system pore protein FliP [Oligoflexia bacterium]|nr:flagellar type III secretion system pore protein FliP [Oligoflexia bacterium]